MRYYLWATSDLLEKSNLEPYDYIAAVEVAIWSLLLIGACPLIILRVPSSTRYNARSALTSLALARIIGSALRLATIAKPSNPGLYIAWIFFVHVGAGNLIVMGFGMLCSLSAGKDGGLSLIYWLATVVRKFMYLCGLASTIVLIVAGATRTDYRENAAGNPNIDYSLLWRVGIALLFPSMGSYLILVLLTICFSKHIGKGAGAVIASAAILLPLIILRLSFTVFMVFGDRSQSVGLYVVMAMVPEILAAVLVEAFGWTGTVWLLRDEV